MDFLKNLENNSFLVIPYSIKDKILDYIDENNLLLNIKLITFSELKKGLLFDYDSRTIYSLMNEYNISYGLAKDYINNMYYLTEDKYKEKKLNNLLDMKNYLDNNNLVIKDDLFIDLLKSKDKLYVYGFDFINKFNKYLLDLASKYIKYEVIDKEEGNHEHVVYEANTIEEEVLYVAENISKLIKDGIPFNKIFITGINEEYDFTLRRIFKAFNIPYFIKNENILYDTALAKYFFNNIDDDINNLLKRIEKKYDVENNESNKTVYNKLISLINKYYWASSYKEVKDIMIEDAKNTTLPSTHMEQEVTMTSIYDNIFYDDEYVFIMNFNQGVYPRIKKDEDYINDDIKPNILETTKELNPLYKESLLKTIKSIKNLTITYKLYSAFNEYQPSYLVRDYFKKEVIDYKLSKYSNSINELLYAKKLDDLLRFKIDDESLPTLKNNYSIPYDEYDNSFSGLNVHIEPHSYSYSSMNNFFNCPFRYYCNNVLYLDEFSKTLDTYLGSLFHYVLEVCLKDKNKDIDEAYDEFISDNDKLPDDDRNKYVCSNKDKFFVEKLREEMHTIMDIVREQYEHIDPSYREEYEYPIEITCNELDLKTKTNALIKGFIDKCIFVGDDVIIIDYKTGTTNVIKRKTIEFGLHAQLPIYLYLLESKFNNINVAGIYLQHILKTMVSKDPKKTYLDIKSNELKLDGLMTDNEDKLHIFDNQDTITLMTLHKNRYYTDGEKEQMKDTIKNLITDCINNVYDAKFDIKPININDGEEVGCQYCKFRDICYMKQNQYNYVFTQKGGDDDE